MIVRSIVSMAGLSSAEIENVGDVLFVSILQKLAMSSFICLSSVDMCIGSLQLGVQSKMFVPTMVHQIYVRTVRGLLYFSKVVLNLMITTTRYY